MRLNEEEAALAATMAEWDIIDCHEHLGPEDGRTSQPADVFTLFSHYTRGDQLVAGMTEAQQQSLFNREIPLERRWATFRPFWEQIRHGSYARAALLAAQRFYDVTEINDETYGPLSEAIQEANTPGLYDRVLRDACHIRVSLTQCGSTDLRHPILVPVMPLIYDVEHWEALAHPHFVPGTEVRTLDDFLNAMRSYVLRVKGEGAVGLKMMSNPYQNPDRALAAEAFRKLQSGAEKRLPGVNPLRDYVVDETIRFAASQDMVICVHTGYWGDFRMLDPLHMIPILQRHPAARFDIYHLGYPWVREALMLGKGFPNVWLNLCWTHIISQRFVMAALDEAIDLIPMNKLLAFGGDYGLPVEKVYGHLVMAREDIARVLAGRVTDGDLTEDQALDLAHKWFWDNPRDLYRLKV